jgi:hypothetical protein
LLIADSLVENGDTIKEQGRALAGYALNVRAKRREFAALRELRVSRNSLTLLPGYGPCVGKDQADKKKAPQSRGLHF